ncbi:MAG TPA: hypothetical protein VGK66_05940, partial [Solirubrobacterales bacterium]
MERTLARRRRGAAVILACVALAAFAGGATVGDGSSEAKDKPGLASTLSAAQLAGERIVVGVSGTAVSPGLHTAIHQGQVAGVVLFAGNFPTRAAGARLI